MNLKHAIYRMKRDVRISTLRHSKRSLRNQKKIICFSHTRTATQSTVKILEAIGDALNINIFWGYLPPTKENLDKLLDYYHVIFYHRVQPGEFPSAFEQIDFQGFHLFRDPRNLLVSIYFSHGFSHELNQYTGEMNRDRVYVQSHTLEEGLMYLMDHSKQFLDTMSTLSEWPTNNTRLLEFHFEDYVENVEEAWIKILNFIDLKIPETKLKNILKKYSFKNLQRITKKRHGVSHYRSAKRNDYQDCFSPAVKQEFKNRYGSLLIKLGYEKNLDW